MYSKNSGGRHACISKPISFSEVVSNGAGEVHVACLHISFPKVFIEVKVFQPLRRSVAFVVAAPWVAATDATASRLLAKRQRTALAVPPGCVVSVDGIPTPFSTESSAAFPAIALLAVGYTCVEFASVFVRRPCPNGVF